MAKTQEQRDIFLEFLGKDTILLFEGLGNLVHLFFETLSSIFKRRVKIKLVLEQMVKIGIDSLPIALTSSFFVGMVFAVQIGGEFVKFGASKYIGGVMGIAVARELAPALTIIADIVCFFGAYLVVVYLINASGVDYMTSAQQLLKMSDIYGGIAKSFVFGMVISIIACYKGLNAKGGAKGVGEATTSSVVASLLALFVLNYFLSVLFFK